MLSFTLNPNEDRLTPDSNPGLPGPRRAHSAVAPSRPAARTRTVPGPAAAQCFSRSGAEMPPPPARSARPVTAGAGGISCAETPGSATHATTLPGSGSGREARR